MKYIPILFSTPMVQAIFNGTKTQTRRIIKNGDALDYLETHPDEQYYLQCAIAYSKYQPGDVLWVRESWNHATNELGQPIGDSFGLYLYKADDDTGKMKPSIHMPKTACRLFLKIVSIRVETLQSISELDAMAEGIENLMAYDKSISPVYYNYMHGLDENGKNLPVGKVDGWDACAASAIDSFKTLWQSINGTDSWAQNPYVWVVEFKPVEKPATF